MKFKALIILFLFLFQYTYSQNYNNEELKDIVVNESKSFTNLQGLKGVPQAANYDLKYHRLEWEINPEVYYIKGAITSFFVPVVAGFNQIYFDFSNALSIDSIVYNGNNLTFSQATTDVLQITLPAVLAQNVLDSITIYYQGAPFSSGGFGSFMQGSHNNDSIIWTLSEPYGALDWWPCKQDLNDKIDSIDVIVTTPSKYRVGSEGLLVSESIIGPNTIYHWKHRYPIAAYLISVAITNYAVYTDVAPLSTGNLNILNYVYREDSLTAAGFTPNLIPVMQMYDTLFGTYPFMNEKYGHAQFGWGGGMEHQTMSSMHGYSFGLMVHELAHQWFGDKVTCGSWKEIWLNEGFATYLTGLSTKNVTPTFWMAWRQGTLSSIVSQPDGSVYNPDTTSVSRIFNGRLTYNKGSYLLRMLEWKIGEVTFFQGLRNYLNDASMAYGYGTTAQLKTHLETVSGLNLTEFFNDWYFGEGFPSYQVNWGQSGNNVTFTVNQTQSDPSVSFYEMPIPVYVKGQNQDTTYVLDHQFSGQTFNVTVPFAIDSVFFDPELWLISDTATILSVADLSKNKEIIIYPNPVMDKIFISFPTNQILIKIEVYDMIGNKVAYQLNNKIPQQIELNLTNLPAGNYIVEVQTNKATIRKKINKI